MVIHLRASRNLNTLHHQVRKTIAEQHITNVLLQVAASLFHQSPHTNTNSRRMVTLPIHDILRKTHTDNHHQVNIGMIGLSMTMPEVDLSR